MVTITVPYTMSYIVVKIIISYTMTYAMVKIVVPYTITHTMGSLCNWCAPSWDFTVDRCNDVQERSQSSKILFIS